MSPSRYHWTLQQKINWTLEHLTGLSFEWSEKDGMADMWCVGMWGVWG